MGIGPVHWTLVQSLDLPSGFTVCELGNQIYLLDGKRGDGEELYRSLGCSRYTNIDGNGDGLIEADLNFPLELKWPGEFDLVTDFGTSEHVFDFAQCWRTIHSLCKPGGLIVFDKPYQRYKDHGFYNVHKTLIKDIARANRYEILRLIKDTSKDGERWIGVYRRTSEAPWQNPNQGKYTKRLKVGEQANASGRPAPGTLPADDGLAARSE
jgi:SAM-dependent methyltransferase